MLEKELNIRIYEKSVALANVQAKQKSLLLMKERIKELEEMYRNQAEKMKKYKSAHEANERKAKMLELNIEDSDSNEKEDD